VWRLGKAVRHSTKTLSSLSKVLVKSTARVLRTVRTGVGIFQIHKERTVPHVGGETRIPQQNPIPGQKHLTQRFELRWPSCGPQPRATRNVDLPSLHKNHLPHRPTRYAQRQQSPRSLPECIGGGVEPYVLDYAKVSVIHLRPRKDGKVEKDLLENIIW